MVIVKFGLPKGADWYGKWELGVEIGFLDWVKLHWNGIDQSKPSICDLPQSKNQDILNFSFIKVAILLSPRSFRKVGKKLLQEDRVSFHQKFGKTLTGSFKKASSWSYSQNFGKVSSRGLGKCFSNCSRKLLLESCSDRNDIQQSHSENNDFDSVNRTDGYSTQKYFQDWKLRTASPQLACRVFTFSHHPFHSFSFIAHLRIPLYSFTIIIDSDVTLIDVLRTLSQTSS